MVKKRIDTYHTIQQLAPRFILTTAISPPPSLVIGTSETYYKYCMMSTDEFSTTCANCGKGEDSNGELKTCTACKMVKYCSRDCQKAHRPQHKKECRKRAAELHDEALFKQPPLPEDCPICFMRMPSMVTGKRYQSCCGKVICSGCIRAGAMGDDQLCPFCRTRAPTSGEEGIERMKKRAELGDAMAIYELGLFHNEGRYGSPQDRNKALELWHRAAELGYTKAYNDIGTAYIRGVERDEKKAIHYWELAAMGGDENGRNNLGCFYGYAGNYGSAIKHHMIAVGSGYNDSVKQIKQLYSNGHATKEDYATALTAYQAYIVEIKSDDRDKAAAYSDNYKYY